MRPTRSFTCSCLALVVLAALSGQAWADYSRVAVGNCTNLAHYATIQLAVNSVSAGSTVEVCPGTYPEQVVINKRLSLQGIANAGQDAAVILPPATGMVANTSDVDTGNPIAAQLLVQNTAGPVVISNLTVDATGNGIGSCTPDLQGILFQSASGTVNHVAVRNQVPGGVPNGCQIGESIYVQTATGSSSTVTVESSSVHNYNKNGITGNDPGTALTVTGNYVQGSGVVPVGGAAQNGIQLGFGATGKITLNTVIDNIYGDPTVASADILLYDSAENAGITIVNNTLGNSQLPIVLYADNLFVAPYYGDGVTITGNHIFGTATYDAIDVCTNGNTVSKNTIFNSADSAVHLDASCGAAFGIPPTGNNNNATSNTIVESACAGILVDTGTSGNNTTTENYYTVPFPITSSTASCPFVAGPTRAKATRKFSPRR